MAEGIQLRMNVKGANKVQRELKQTGRAAKTMGGGMAGASAAASGLAAMLNPVALIAAAAAASLVVLTGGAVGAAVALKKTFSATLGLAKNLDEIGKKAKSIGSTSAEDLQLLIGAFELAGTESAVAVKGMQKLNQTMGEAMKPGAAKTYTDIFRDLGVSAEDLAKMPLRERLLSIADGMERLGDRQRQAQVGSLLMGRGFKDMIVGMDDREGLQGAIEDMEGFGVASNESVRNSEELQDAVLRMNKAFFGLKVNALDPLIPVLTGYANGIANVVREMDKADAKSFGDRLADIASGPFLKFLMEAEVAVYKFSKALVPAIKLTSLMNLPRAVMLGWSGVGREIGEATALMLDFDRVTEEYSSTAGKRYKVVADAIVKARAEGLKPYTGGGGITPEGEDAPAGEVGTKDSMADWAKEQGDRRLAVLKHAQDVKEQMYQTFYRDDLSELRRKWAEENALISEALQIGDINVEESARLRARAAMKLFDEKKKLGEMTEQQEATLVQGSIDAAQATFQAATTFANLAADNASRRYGEGSAEAKKAAKEAFAVGQAMALSTAIVGTAASIATAAIGPPGIPWAIPQMVAAGISGAAQIATIVGTSIQGVGHAGIPPGALSGLGMDNMTVLMKRNEMILDPVGTSAISSMLQARASGRENVTVNTVLELDGQVLGQTVDTHLIRSSERGLGYQERVRY